MDTSSEFIYHITETRLVEMAKRSELRGPDIFKYILLNGNYRILT